MPEPVWLPVPDYEGLYEVSDSGLVRSIARRTTRGGVRAASLWGKRRAYLRVTLSKDGHIRTAAVHSLVAAAFLGPRPADMEVRHIDGDSLNNRLSNLAYGTHAENGLDRRRHGTARAGQLKRWARRREVGSDA
jgi:hypothetical protein